MFWKPSSCLGMFEKAVNQLFVQNVNHSVFFWKQRCPCELMHFFSGLHEYSSQSWHKYCSGFRHFQR